MDRNPYSNGRAGEGTRPYGENRTVAVGSAEPGAVVEPQQRQFLQTQGPVARMEPQKVTRRRGGETPPVKNQSSPGSSKVNFPNFPPRNSSSRTLAIRSVSNSPPEMRMPRFPAASSRIRYP